MMHTLNFSMANFVAFSNTIGLPQILMLILLAACVVWLVYQVSSRMRAEKDPQNAVAESPSETAPVIEEEFSDAVEGAEDDDGALVAAITAAISASLAEEGYTGSFRVVSFKRSGSANARRRF